MTQEFEDRKRENFIAYLEASAEFEDLEFDLWARDPQDFVDLNDALIDFHMLSAGGMCPFQAEGYMNSYYFYLRSRHGSTSLNVARNKEDVYLEPLWSSSVEKETSSHNLTEVFLLLTRALEKADFCFYFEGYPWLRTEDSRMSVDTTWRDRFAARGQNAQEAYENLFETSDYLREMLKLSVEEFVDLRKEQDLQRTPVNSDTRVFPEQMPVFLK